MQKKKPSQQKDLQKFDPKPGYSVQEAS